MSAEDYFYDEGIDDFDYGEEATCTRCLKSGLTWDKNCRGKWYLAESNGRPHECREKDLHRAVVDDFEDLT